VLGEGDRRLELMPHPMADDPAGRASRFYGRAEWLRGGRVERAWIECCGPESQREDFRWSHGWEAGRRHGDMWREMREHGEQMREHGMGMAMGMAPGTAPQAQAPMPHEGEAGEMPPGGEHGPGRMGEHMPAGPMGVAPSASPATQATPAPPSAP
jgi:hypothetical protein